jgi:hypothetical protein
MLAMPDTITPRQLREQIGRMWLRNYPAGPTDQNWLLNVGIGAGMMSRAAGYIEELERRLGLPATAAEECSNCGMPVPPGCEGRFEDEAACMLKRNGDG